MLISLPLLAYVILVLLFLLTDREENVSIAFIQGHVSFFAVIAASTEFLSLFHALDLPHLMLIWSFFNLIILSVYLLWKRRRLKATLNNIFQNTPSLLDHVLIFSVILILLITLVVGFLYPPNNSDAMIYHMARVMHWIQDSTVAFYPTPIASQNYQMPLAEFAILHFQILSGGDHFAHLVQWLCFVVSVCLAAALAKELGGNWKSQIASAVSAVTIPMAILQSSSTQNDLVVSSFILSFALFMLKMAEKITLNNVIFAGLSLGLALLSKGTAYIYCSALAPLLLIFLISRKNSDRWKWKLCGAFSLIMILAVMINLGFFMRNMHLYQSPITTESRYYRNDTFSLSNVYANMLRNAALHLGTTSKQLNRYAHAAMKWALGDEIDNPDTTWMRASLIIQRGKHEDNAGNPIHLILTVIIVPAVIMSRRQNRQTRWFAITLLAAAVWYSLILKWQPWGSRLHTPIFLLAAPLIGIGLSTSLRRMEYAYVLGVFCMLINSIPFVLSGEPHNLISGNWIRKERKEHYFHHYPQLYNDYRKAVGVLIDADAQDVGLYINNTAEYPLWALVALENSKGKQIRFRHIGVTNISQNLETKTSLPFFIFATKNVSTWEESEAYRMIFSSPHVTILEKMGLENRSL